MTINWDEVQAITDLTFIIQQETGFGLALAASVAERLWKEGYRKVEEDVHCASPATPTTSANPMT